MLLANSCPTFRLLWLVAARLGLFDLLSVDERAGGAAVLGAAAVSCLGWRGAIPVASKDLSINP